MAFESRLTETENQIAELIIRPLMRRKDERISPVRFFDIIFTPERVHFCRYRVLDSFNAMGWYWVCASLWTQYSGRRLVKAGSLIVVRHYEQTPNRFDIEVIKSDEDDTRVFTCNRLEWSANRKYLTCIDKKNKSSLIDQ